MARNTRRTTHPYQHVPARRGVAGYVGVAADAKADPPVVFPPRTLVVPAVADTPVSAGGEELDLAGPGGAAEPGTVVVTPGNETDVAAALEAAAAPSAINPFVTEEGVSGVQVVARTLTSAEILALATSPIVLLPGLADIVYWPVGAVAVYRFGAAEYVGGSVLNIGWPGTVGFALQVDANIPGLSTTLGMVTGMAGLSAALTFMEGEPLSVYLDAPDPTNGDGEVDLTVLYRRVDVS